MTEAHRTRNKLILDDSFFVNQHLGYIQNHIQV